ncbi:hypothetical protein [Pseudomonas serbica]|uniref:hypothetical protein n=1 Tax=Pseudomonas serbica TaxID=2965074 RepID=UPI00237BEEE8|nr:hypothetical protein [Pseudomonas serbica]
MEFELITATRALLKGIEGDLPADSPFLADLQDLLAGANEYRVAGARLPALRVADEGQELDTFDKGWNACVEKATSLNNPRSISTLRGSAGEPEVFIHVHELIGSGGGIWLGSSNEDDVRKAYDEGETGTEIVSLVRLGDHREHVSKLLIRNMELETEVKALKLADTDNPAKPCTNLEEANKKLLHYGQWVAAQTHRLTQAWGRIDLLEALASKRQVGQCIDFAPPPAVSGTNWWDGLKAEAYGVFWTDNGVAHSRFTQEGEGPRSLAFGRDYVKSLFGDDCSDIEPVVRLSEVIRLSAGCTCRQAEAPANNSVQG